MPRSSILSFRSILRSLLVALLIAAGVAAWLVGSATWMPGRSHEGPLPEISGEQLRLRDELRRDLETLTVTIGHRGMHAIDGLRKAESFIEGEFAAVGYVVERQTYAVAGVDCSNLLV